jgi:DNA-binding transcriptional LysR family regulator
MELRDTEAKVLAGLGIGVLSVHVVAESTPAKRVAIRRIEALRMMREFTILTRRERQPGLRLKVASDGCQSSGVMPDRPAKLL